MTPTKLFLLSMVVFAFLDFIWIGYVMANTYKELIGPLARLNADGSWNINFIAALGVYILLAAALVFFVFPQTTGGNMLHVFLMGALMGLIIYGVYDLTNAATLVRWPLTMIIVDVAWGAVVSGITAVVVTNLGKMFGWV